MSTQANQFGITWDNAKDKAEKKIKQGEKWFKDETVSLEQLVSRGGEDAKQRLLEMARKYQANVNERMDVGEIKNKIKAKLREMR